MKEQNSKCLLLNADYSLLSIISWKKAIIWDIKYQNNPKYSIEIIDFYKNDYILGVNDKKIPIPAVAKTKRFFHINRNPVNFSRKNLFLRDDYTCQYCYKIFEENKLTYDHVIPKSAWKDIHRSPTNWTNIVTACISCNFKKANRTPKQANMPLKKLPDIPNKSLKYLPIGHHLLKIKNTIPCEWSAYLPQSYFI